VLQIQGVKGEAVVFYRKPFTTKELRRHRLSLWVNNMAVFTIFMMSLRVNSIKAEKMSINTYHYSHSNHFAMLFMQL
jgi:hypothetical protein